MGRDAAVWFVMIGGQQQGPMSRAEVGLSVGTGSIDGETFVWKEGMQDWLPGAEVPELRLLFLPPPKQPVKPPPPPLAAQKPKPANKGQGMPTFDTSHFKVREEIEDQDAAAASKIPEFSTGHFRAGDAAESSLSLEMNLPVHKPGVPGHVEPPKTAPKPVRDEVEEDVSDRTHVEVLPFGERVHQESVASDLFDVTGHSTTSARPLDPSKWDPKPAVKAPIPRPAAVIMPQPAPPAPRAKSKTTLIAALVVLALAVAALAYF